MRVVVHTANYLYGDCNVRTQGAYVQDFPLKTATSPRTSDFEKDLIGYASVLQHVPAGRGQNGKGRGGGLRCALKWAADDEGERTLPVLLAGYDYSQAYARLVGSTPGYHRGAERCVVRRMASYNPPR